MPVSSTIFSNRSDAGLPQLPEPVEQVSCAICGNVSGNRTFAAREMMFGFRDTFPYMECACCGCVQLMEAPPDLDRYYPREYFPDASRSEASAAKKRLHHERAKYCLQGHSALGRILVALLGRPKASIFGTPDYYSWLSKCGIGFSSSILDVGCGLGTLLVRLHNDGFSSLVGVDPLINESIHFGPGLDILKRDLADVDGAFDLVMLHHTFEHLAAPAVALSHVLRVLKSGGYALIRIPVASSFAYAHYGADWAQLDAPRHQFLHSLKSIRLLADQAGLQMVDVVFDSTEFQFWASEQYIRDIPLKDERSYAVNAAASPFSHDQIAHFRQRSIELNACSQGDSACFYLRKP